MGDEDLIFHAERAVIDAAVELASKPPPVYISPELERLRTAVYMLRKARTITGKIDLASVHEGLKKLR
jgi:hypothetical protein